MVDWKVRVDRDGDGRAEADVSALVRRFYYEQEGRGDGVGLKFDVDLIDLDGTLAADGLDGHGVQMWGVFPGAGSGAAGANLSGTAWESGGYTWTKWNSGNNGFVYDGDNYRPVGTDGSDAYYVVDWGSSSVQRLGCRVRRQGSDIGIVLGGVNTWQLLRVEFGATSTILTSTYFGWPTTRRRGDPLTNGVEYWVEVVLERGEVRLYTTPLESGGSQSHDMRDNLTWAIPSNFTVGKYVGLWHKAKATTGYLGGFGGSRAMFRGVVGKVRRRGFETVLECHDELRDLADVRVNYARESGGIQRSDNLLDSVLTLGGFSSNHRRLYGAGVDLYHRRPIVLWNLPTRAGALRVAREAGEWLVIDGRGYIVTLPSYEVDTGDGLVADFADNPGYLEYEREVDTVPARAGLVEVNYFQLDNTGAQQYWELETPIGIGANGSIQLLAETVDYYAVFNLRTPTANTDYKGNSNYGGTGTDRTSNLTVTIDTTTFEGRGCVVNVTNSRNSTVYLTELRLWTNRSYEEKAPVAALAGTTGPVLRELKCYFLDNFEAAQSVADRLAQRNRAGAEVALSLPLWTEANKALAVRAEVGDRFSIPDIGTGLTARFLVRQVRITWAEGDGKVEYALDARASS